MDELKKCNACGVGKPLSEFYFRGDNGKPKNRCKECCISGKLKAKSDTHKKCKHCGIEKPFSDYQKVGGGKWLQPYCKPCDAERKRQYNAKNEDRVLEKRRAYYQDNKEQISGRQKIYNEKVSDRIRERSKKWNEKNKDKKRIADLSYQIVNAEKIKKKNKERYEKNKDEHKRKGRTYRENRTPEQIAKKKEYDRQYKQNNKAKFEEYREKNKDKIRERNRKYNRIKSANDINFRLLKNLRSRVHVALKRGVRSETTKQLLGCSLDFFKDHFQSLFTEGMTWDKYMDGEIHIDHIIPCKHFDLTKIEEQRICFNYKNLQPLWELDNLKKGIYVPNTEFGGSRESDKIAI